MDLIRNSIVVHLSYAVRIENSDLIGNVISDRVWFE